MNLHDKLHALGFRSITDVTRSFGESKAGVHDADLGVHNQPI